MSMYALQVMTGMEAEITQKLRGKGVDARCPQERRMIRRGGKWQEQLYTLFPSYIFVSTPDVYRVYYAVRHEDGVLHWLGATKGTPEALSAHEEANILWLAGDGPLPPSEAEMQADGTLDFTSGPLAHLKDINEGKEDEKQGFRPRLVDWEQDAALIAPAVDKVLGYSCRRCEYLHWWEFLGAFHGIGDGLFAQVVNIRNKRARGKMLDKSEQEFARENAAVIKIHAAESAEDKAEKERLLDLLGR